MPLRTTRRELYKFSSIFFPPQLVYRADLTEVCLLPQTPPAYSAEEPLSRYHAAGTHPREWGIWGFLETRPCGCKARRLKENLTQQRGCRFPAPGRAGFPGEGRCAGDPPHRRGETAAGAAAPVTSGPRDDGRRGARAAPAGAPATPDRLHSLGRAGPVDGGSIRSGVKLNRSGLLLRHFRPRTAQRVRDGEAPAPLRPGSRDFLRRSKVGGSPRRRCPRGLRAASSAGECLWWCRRQTPAEARRPSRPAPASPGGAAPSSLPAAPDGENCPGSKCALLCDCACAHRPGPPSAQARWMGACAVWRSEAALKLCPH